MRVNLRFLRGVTWRCLSATHYVYMSRLDVSTRRYRRCSVRGTTSVRVDIMILHGFLGYCFDASHLDFSTRHCVCTGHGGNARSLKVSTRHYAAILQYIYSKECLCNSYFITVHCNTISASQMQFKIFVNSLFWFESNFFADEHMFDFFSRKHVLFSLS